MSRLRRFLHIERSRAERPAAARPAVEPATESAGRFNSVERPSGAPAPPPATGARLERFGAAPPPVVEAAASRRAMGEEIAREVGRRERLRLSAELGADPFPWSAPVRLLRRLLRALRRGGSGRTP